MDIYKLLSKFGFSAAVLLAVIASAISLASVDAAVYSMYVFIILALAAAILLPVVGALDNPKVLIKAGIGVGGVLILFFISWAMSSETDIDPSEATGNQIKLAGALLNTMWILFVGALGAIAVTEVLNIVRK